MNLKNLLLLIILCALFGKAQTINNQSKDEIIAQIKILEALQTKAILESDTITLAKIWAEEYHVNSPTNLVVNRSQVFQRIKNTFIKYSTYTQEPEYYGVFDDVVIVMGKETVVPTGDNPDKDKILTRRYTDIYKMINGEWKGISRHANIVKD